jgi:hypothetical protein
VPSLPQRARSARAPRVLPRTASAGRRARNASASFSAGMRRRSKRWQRDSTVTGTLFTSVVANRNFTCAGGSSSVFSKRVEGVLRQHVDFVDDVDLVARRDRRIAHRLDDLAHVVDAGMAGGVHLDHVDVPALGDRDGRARTPRTASIVGPPCPSGPMQLSALAISRAVEVLPTPRTPVSRKACARPIALDRVAQRGDHRILADQLGKGLRAIFAGEHAIRRRCDADIAFADRRSPSIVTLARAGGLRWEAPRCRPLSEAARFGSHRRDWVGAGTTRGEFVTAASFRI